MAKVGYIMATSQYDKLEEDRKWMNEFGCVRIIEESDDNERHRPLWKQLMAALQRGDELVIPKFSNALRGSRELAIFLEFCRVKVIRIISIHDRIDSSNNLVEYEATELDELTLAYASTIHKSQGSEYPIVVIPVLMTHFVMLQRNLIYTGITRAKKICVLIGQPKALAYAIRNLTVINRNTKLKERLRGEIEANNDSGLHISSRYILPEEQPMMAAEPEPNPDIRSNIK